MLTVYGFSRVNKFAHSHTRDLRVLWALEEMGLPYRIHGMDHPAHELSGEEYRKLSPFEQIPALVDGEVVLSESGAILHYLARKSGKLIPADAAGEAQVLRWCFAALNTVELPLVPLMFLGWTKAKGEGAQTHIDAVTQWAHRALGNLDRWLAGRQFVATDEFTIADVLMAHAVQGDDGDALYAPHAHVRAYRARCRARPAWQRTIAAYRARVEAT